ncbi:MAG: hypothetical protein FMNOHCHN_03139 [Ignavibacteriaceae bacterium]|nr:hypothetical protein [Ignavibacteriaceae bacterium]
MATNKNRLAKLEKQSGTGEKIKYICTSYPDDTEYIAKPFIGEVGETFTFKTAEAMTAYFDKHKEFELLHIRVMYASEAENAQP